MTRIFLVEDDSSFGEVLKAYLEINGFSVHWVQDGRKALEQFDKTKFDFCVFDVMLPHVDGFTVAKTIKEIAPTIPFIFLTAKTLKEDELKGYKTGADDYIKKPFDSEVLIYKIKAIARRHSNGGDENNGEYELGNFSFSAKIRELKHVEQAVPVVLSPKESELLQMLLDSKGEVLPRAEALNKIWGDDNYFTTRSMDVYITKLRKYLKDDSRIQILKIHGSGYRLIVNN